MNINIDKENKDPRRGYGHENVLTEISIDKETHDQLTCDNKGNLRKLENLRPRHVRVNYLVLEDTQLNTAHI